MAGSEQRPTDDVEGHAVKYRGLDTEAADEDDVEGHGVKYRGLDTEAVDEDQGGDATKLT